MERHAVCSSFSLCAEQLELPLQTSPLNPSSPSSTTLSLCVCVCEDLATKRAEQWQLGRMTSEQVDISAHAYGRVISGCLEPAGGQGSPLALTNMAKCNNDKVIITALKDVSEIPFSSNQHKPCKGCIASSERDLRQHERNKSGDE